MVSPGTARLGRAQLGYAKQGKARFFFSKARCSEAASGNAELGVAKQGFVYGNGRNSVKQGREKTNPSRIVPSCSGRCLNVETETLNES